MSDLVRTYEELEEEPRVPAQFFYGKMAEKWKINQRERINTRKM